MLVRLEIPFEFYMDAASPESLEDPRIKFAADNLSVSISFDGDKTLKLETGDEPYFRAIKKCKIEIQDSTDDLSALIKARDYAALFKRILPLVNRIVRNIRNIGWITGTAEFSAEEDPEAMLNEWYCGYSEDREKWKSVVRPPEGTSRFLALSYLFPITRPKPHTGSLSAARIPEVEEAMQEDRQPNPEQEFLTNSLEHLRQGNLRLAVLEAVVCLEIVLSQFLRDYLESRREFSVKKINRVLNNVGLTTRTGLLLELILSSKERDTAKLDIVLKCIHLRNRIVHEDGHIPRSVPSEEIRNAITTTLQLALKLGDRRDIIRSEPEVKAIADEVAVKFSPFPVPTIKLGRMHFVHVRFHFYLRAASAALAPLSGVQRLDKPPSLETMNRVVDFLAERLKKRDRFFNAKDHLIVSFEDFPNRLMAIYNDGELLETVQQSQVKK